MKDSIKVGLVQIGEDFGGQYYLPYSMGVLQAYAQRKLTDRNRYEFLLPVYKRMPIDEITSYFKDVGIVFFSTYLWNFKFSLSIAKKMKEVYPDCIIVFGGPQIPIHPESMESFLRKNSHVDIGCYGEGEIPFVSILENVHERDWSQVPSIGFIQSDGSFVWNMLAEKIPDLNDIPSPYLDGVFDSLIKANPKESWSAMWETNRGCPFTCSFCAWGVGDRKVRAYDIERLFLDVDWFSANSIEFVFCCDANYGLFKERDLLLVEKIAQNKQRCGYPMAFSVQNTKNVTDTIFRLQKTLNQAGLQKGVNLALQSVNEETLKSIRRNNISIKTYHDLQEMFTCEGIPTFSDMIIGLPNETYDSFTSGIASVVEGGQHNRIQFINLSVLENTEMAQPEYQQEYGMVLKECKMVSHHTRLDNGVDISETENLVVGTNTMPEADWVRTRVFCWMISLLYFNKLLQIPFIVLNRTCSLSYKELTEIFLVDDDNYPVLTDIRATFIEKALSIQSGDCEYIPAQKWLNIWWPADEYVFIKLCHDGLLYKFYEEAERAIGQHLKKLKCEVYPRLLHEAMDLNQQLLKKPLVTQNQSIHLSYNLLDVYKTTLIGQDMPIREGDYYYQINYDSRSWESWDDWFREVVWYGTKKGNYLYDCVAK